MLHVYYTETFRLKSRISQANERGPFAPTLADLLAVPKHSVSHSHTEAFHEEQSSYSLLTEPGITELKAHRRAADWSQYGLASSSSSSSESPTYSPLYRDAILAVLFALTRLADHPGAVVYMKEYTLPIGWLCLPLLCCNLLTRSTARDQVRQPSLRRLWFTLALL